MWHGFYPFYYVMFISAGMFVELSKDFYRAKILFEVIPQPYRYIITFILSHCVMNYYGALMTLFQSESCTNFCKGTYYYVLIIIPLLLAVSKLGGMVPYARKIEKKRLEKL